METATLFPDERLDEVNDRLSLIQKPGGLTFGTDALLLAAFIRKKGDLSLELGGGSGIVSMLLATRERFSRILCAEIQPAYADLCRRNVLLNRLEERIRVVEADVRDVSLLGEKGSYDAVFSNPPYMTVSSGYACRSEAKNVARHEVCGSIFDFAKSAAAMLKYGGSFYVVYRSDRMADLFAACYATDLSPKRMTLVHARADLPPSMLLLEARRGGGVGMRVSRPLILTADGKNTADYEYLLCHGILPDDY